MTLTLINKAKLFYVSDTETPNTKSIRKIQNDIRSKGIADKYKAKGL